MGRDILLRPIVEHQNGVEGVVGDHLGGGHGEDAVESRVSRVVLMKSTITAPRVTDKITESVETVPNDPQKRRLSEAAAIRKKKCRADW